MNSSKSQGSGRGLAVVSYFWLFGIVIAYFLNQEKQRPLVRFHIRQSLGLWIIYMILGYVIGYFDSWTLTMAFWIGFGLLFLYGIFNAASGRTNPIPIIGSIMQRLFSNL